MKRQDDRAGIQPDRAPEITITRVSAEVYDALKSGFDLYPFFERFWLESFKRRNREAAYFAFFRKRKLAGLAAGILDIPRLAVRIPGSKRVHLFGLPEIWDADPAAIFNAFEDYLRGMGCGAVHVAPFDTPSRYDLKIPGFSKRSREEFVVDLTSPLPDMWNNLDKHGKRTIGKASNAGLMFGEYRGPLKPEDLIGRLDASLQQKLGKGFGDFDFHDIRFLGQDIVAGLLKSKCARVYCVFRENAVLGACLVVRNERHARCLFAGTTPEGYRLHSPRLMFWRLIEKMKEDGCTSLNLGGVPGDGLAAHVAEFKRSLGAEPRICEGGVCHLSSPFHKLLYGLYRHYDGFLLTKFERDRA
jgi:hypothetical protein